MRRRSLLAALGTAGTVGAAGCGSLGGETALMDPSVLEDSPGQRALVFEADGDEVGHFGVDGSVDSGVVRLDTEIWHRSRTHVQSIHLRLWMPDSESDTPADVAVVSPVEGDSSPPPAVSLYSPDRELGTAVEVTDIDDLADETIATIDLLVRPWSEVATTVAVDCRIELASTRAFGTDYALDGRLELAYPELAEGSA